MTETELLLTAEEYRVMPEGDRPSELVKGRIVEHDFHYPGHGVVCMNLTLIIGNFADESDLGYALATGFITERNPDTVRGPDLSFYSYSRLPKGRLPEAYPDVAPEVTFEVQEPQDAPQALQAKVGEYLRAGAKAVFVFDVDTDTVSVIRPDRPSHTLNLDDELFIPEIADFVSRSGAEVLRVSRHSDLRVSLSQLSSCGILELRGTCRQRG